MGKHFPPYLGMSFPAAVHQLILHSEIPQQQTVCCCFICSSLTVTSHGGISTGSRSIRLGRTAVCNTDSAQNPYLCISSKCWKRADSKGRIHKLKLSVRVGVVTKLEFQWKSTIIELWLFRITFSSPEIKRNTLLPKSNTLAKREKFWSHFTVTFHTTVPYLPLKGSRERKTIILMLQNKALDNRRNGGRWHQETTCGDCLA